ncbi:MAG: penicillin-binding protein [Candidatus Hydrogenedentota bacterium]
MRNRGAIALLGLAGLGLMAWAAAPRAQRDAVFALAPSPVLLDRQGEMLHPFLNDEEAWCFPRALEEFSPYLIQATLSAEDQRFFSHPGVDPLAVLRAAAGQLRGGLRSGASTLTMQTVNLSGHRSSSLAGKFGQMARAISLEMQATKEEILGLYLNKAPYGFNLIGAEAAALRYFGKPARELTLPEAALLAGMPKAPSRFQPLRDADRARARRAYVLRRMAEDGHISAQERDAANAAPLGAAWHAYPQHAPHLARAARAEARSSGALRTTLDRALQARCEEAIARHLLRYNGEITNAAAMVVDVDSGQVLARVGSAGFHSVPGGQVDLCVSPRSPGSTLKPFTYALAIEQGLLYPTEKLLDDTIDFGSYAPENFDGVFNGMVSGAQALQLSLNVPAVAALDRVGLPAMQSFLQRAGITTLTHPSAHYGLGLTLGNCGVRLDELCEAYLMLANLGERVPLMDRIVETPPTTERLLRPDTAYAIWQMLEHPFPKEPAAHLVRGSNALPRVCWKTGTSTGQHDAWAVAFNRHYVAAVWVGNSDGTPSPRLVGAVAALPLAGTLFRALPAKNTPSWPDDNGLRQHATLCATSGLPVGIWCPHSESALLPAGQFLNRRCDMHHPGGLTRWPADARRWDLARISNAVETASADADAAPMRRALRITAPAEGAQYVLTGESNGDRILLRGSIDDDAPLAWYHNGRFLGESSSSQPLYLQLSPGPHKLTVMAQAGLSDTVQFNVALPGDL